jgi:predicted RNA-binding protein with PIN domain
MALLIDGYNLLHVTGIVGRGIGPGTLQRSRLALLNFLAESLEPGELPHTTIVFDAHEASGLAEVTDHRGMSVHFATKYASADDLIEELIAADSAPRRLVVVSSDHRIQRAARRRRAKAVDSDVWYAELIRARRERHEAQPDAPVSPMVPLLAEDVNYWLRQFGGESLLAELVARESRAERPADVKPIESEAGPIDNPFPPGYGEDLLEGL